MTTLRITLILKIIYEALGVDTIVRVGEESRIQNKLLDHLFKIKVIHDPLDQSAVEYRLVDLLVAYQFDALEESILERWLIYCVWLEFRRDNS